MSKIEDGGPAFPVPGLSNLPNGDFIHPEWGMTLRDYFAAKAMQALLSHHGAYEEGARFCSKKEARKRDSALSNDVLANYAYGVADAMLAAREAS